MNASAGSWKRDLDEETRMKLEEFLEQFPGTVENVMFFNSRDSRYQITSELMINLLMIWDERENYLYSADEIRIRCTQKLRMIKT